MINVEFIPPRPRYVLARLPAGCRDTGTPDEEARVWYIQDTVTLSKSDLYPVGEAMTILHWLTDREAGYEWTDNRMRGIIPA